MTFANPWALLLLVAIIPLILVYFFREKERSLPVSSLLFWETLGVHTSQPKPLLIRRFISDPLFWLQLLLLFIVVGALAEPILVHSVRRILLFVDVSASMQTHETGGTRLALAKDHARKAIDAMETGDQMALFTIAHRPEQRVPFTGDQTRLRASLEALMAQDTPTHLEAAFTLATSLGDSIGAMDVVVVTDQPVNRPETQTSEASTRFHVLTVGTTDVNAGFVSLDHGSGVHEIRLTARNFGTKPLAGTVIATQAGRTFLRQNITLTPNATIPIALPGLTGAEPITVRLTASDSLAVDNEVVFLPFSSSRPSLLAVTKRLELIRLLQVFDRFNLTVVPSVNQIPQATAFDGYLYDGLLPDALPPGGTLVLNPATRERYTTEEPVYDWDAGHPLLNGIVLERLSLIGAGKLEAPPNWATVIARTREYPVAIAGQEADFRRAILMMDLIRQNENPTALLLFLKALRWISPSSEAEAVQFHTGAVIRGRATGDSVSALMTTPLGVTDKIPVNRGEWRFMETTSAGLYTLKRSGVTRLMAVNLLDAQESDITPVRGASAYSGPVTLSSRSSVATDYWRRVLEIGLALLCLTWGYEALRPRLP